MSQCKHVNMNNGCHCENNAAESNPFDFCKKHYEMRKALESKGYSFASVKCQNVKRGKQPYCNNNAVEGLHSLCQECYDKAKEKRKKLIEEEKEELEVLRILYRESNRAFATYNTALQRLRVGTMTTVFESSVEDLYYYVWYSELTLEEKRNLVHEMETTLFPEIRNIVPDPEDVRRLRDWCENEDDHIFLPRPVVRFTTRPPKPTTLQQIAGDSQNVHTKEVVKQSNTTIEKLLELAAKDTKLDRVPDFFAAKWLMKKYGSWAKVKPITEDMIIWYNTSQCKTENDWLYKKVLHGLYIYWENVKNRDMKRELLYRIFQECRESVGMCCEGHLSRLANALVGFDEEAVPQLSTGEILQQKMAAIAAMGISYIEKYMKAKAVLKELNIPEDKHSDWLEAF